VALEVCSLPLRILAIRKATQELRAGRPLQSYPVPACMENLYEESRLPHFYMMDMKRLSMERRFFGALDQQTFALGFRAGVESVLRIADTEMQRRDHISSATP
jgi:hypothetical protein